MRFFIYTLVCFIALSAAPVLAQLPPVTNDGTLESQLPLSVPTLSIKSDGKAVELVAATKKLDQGFYKKCSACNGTGTVHEKVEVGRSGGFVQRPVYDDRARKCTTCDGTGGGVQPEKVITAVTGNFLNSLAKVNLDDPAATDALTDSFKVLTQKIIGDRGTFVYFTNKARGLAAQKKIAQNSPVIFKLRVIGSVKLTGQTDKATLGVISGTNQLVLITSPVSAEQVKPRDRVLAGGLIAGESNNSKDDRVIIVQGGFIFLPPTERTWTWWNMEKD